MRVKYEATLVEIIECNEPFDIWPQEDPVEGID